MGDVAGMGADLFGHSVAASFSCLGNYVYYDAFGGMDLFYYQWLIWYFISLEHY
jgi:hypothetical protein